jgi:hypothetical protein
VGNLQHRVHGWCYQNILGQLSLKVVNRVGNLGFFREYDGTVVILCESKGEIYFTRNKMEDKKREKHLAIELHTTNFRDSARARISTI